MSKWIDAEWIRNVYADFEHYEDRDDWTTPIANVLAVIDDAPSIDIVRCKECKHNPWDFDRTDYTCVWDDDFADRPQTPDDFCSYGERKESEQ